MLYVCTYPIFYPFCVYNIMTKTIPDVRNEQAWGWHKGRFSLGSI